MGWQAHRGFLRWAVFALSNGILICCGRALKGLIVALAAARGLDAELPGV
jgi:hypothetical protein